jgi:hypothetical protein
MSLLGGMDAIDIRVPTPLRNADPDPYIILAVEAVAATQAGPAHHP